MMKAKRSPALVVFSLLLLIGGIILMDLAVFAPQVIAKLPQPASGLALTTNSETENGTVFSNIQYGAATTSWSNPQGAKKADGNLATASTSSVLGDKETTTLLTASGFNFQIPEDATVTGVLATFIRGSGLSTPQTPAGLQYYTGNYGGNYAECPNGYNNGYYPYNGYCLGEGTVTGIIISTGAPLYYGADQPGNLCSQGGSYIGNGECEVIYMYTDTQYSQYYITKPNGPANIPCPQGGSWNNGECIYTQTNTQYTSPAPNVVGCASSAAVMLTYGGVPVGINHFGQGYWPVGVEAAILWRLG